MKVILRMHPAGRGKQWILQKYLWISGSEKHTKFQYYVNLRYRSIWLKQLQFFMEYSQTWRETITFGRSQIPLYNTTLIFNLRVYIGTMHHMACALLLRDPFPYNQCGLWLPCQKWSPKTLVALASLWVIWQERNMRKNGFGNKILCALGFLFGLPTGHYSQGPTQNLLNSHWLARTDSCLLFDSYSSPRKKSLLILQSFSRSLLKIIIDHTTKDQQIMCPFSFSYTSTTATIKHKANNIQSSFCKLLIKL